MMNKAVGEDNLRALPPKAKVEMNACAVEFLV